MKYFATYDAPFGLMTLTADDEGLTGVWLGEHAIAVLVQCTGNETRSLPALCSAAEWFDAYFAGKRPETLPQLHLCGTPFQLRVWNELLKIPYGALTTYGDLAKTLAAQADKRCVAAQAVGGAVGSNPVSIIVPCHRVIGSDGNLTGYGGGIDFKVALLELEGHDMSRFTMPKRPTKGHFPKF